MFMRMSQTNPVEQLKEQLNREWTMEDFVPQQINLDEPWRGKEEALADNNLDSFVDVREFLQVGKEWGKVFDPYHGLLLMNQMIGGSSQL